MMDERIGLRRWVMARGSAMDEWCVSFGDSV